MKNLKLLEKRIISTVNANLRVFGFDTQNFVKTAIEYDKLSRFYCFYGITAHYPIDFKFRDSSMAGSYFLGKCSVLRSIVYKSDIRGDELKRKGEKTDHGMGPGLIEDETIVITGSLLYKTLVHNNSHNPGTPEEFSIRNTVSAHYANIHGSTMEGCFLGAFSTIDLMNLHSCIVGEFSYIQTGSLFHKRIDPGLVHIETDDFCFRFRHKKQVLDTYIGVNRHFQPRGLIYRFVRDREPEYEHLFSRVEPSGFQCPQTSAVNRYAVIKGDVKIGENVLISQRAYLDEAHMGDGSNAQENTFIINSRLAGMNITAHGGKIMNAEIGQKTFVGFNSFLAAENRGGLVIGKRCIVMPHTIIDCGESIEIPDDHVVWGYIRTSEDLEKNTIAIDKLAGIKTELVMDGMRFTGSGRIFVQAFMERIEHILEANGAYYDGGSQGHAQKGQQISFNTLQPYRSGENLGLYPFIRILP
jgi:carbonic anhydrase/acetyltransferase-like protein (isoleucine patch superfamily)